MAHFRIITGDGCTFCDKAKELLTSRGDTFDQIDILDAADEMKVLGVKKIPQIFRRDGGRESEVHIGGYTDLVAYLGLS